VEPVFARFVGERSVKSKQTDQHADFGDRQSIGFAFLMVTAGVILSSFLVLSAAAKQPPSPKESAAEPIKYVGVIVCDKRYYDGRLRHAIGVHNYQAMRANRTKLPEGGMVGWTYNHQPYFCYWNNRFYIKYLSNLTGEHVPRGRTLVMTSKDGLNWSNPRVLFPKYALPRIKGHYDDVGDVDLPGWYIFGNSLEDGLLYCAWRQAFDAGVLQFLS